MDTSSSLPEVTSKPADDFALHFGEEVLEHLGARFCGFDEDTAAHVWVALTRDQTTLSRRAMIDEAVVGGSPSTSATSWCSSAQSMPQKTATTFSIR